MKPKNVMLLGFINRAVEYLDNHMDEEPDSRLAELKNIDLASLRDELTDNLDTSLGTMESTMNTLLKAGNEAFDQFLEDSHGQKTIIQEFDRLFDVDLDGARKNKQQQLAKLLSFYNLEKDFDMPDIKTVEAAEDEDKYLQEIAKQVTNDDISGISSKPKTRPKANTEELDNVYSEILSNEKTPTNRTTDKKTNVVDKKKNEYKATNLDKKEIAKDDTKYVNSLISDLKKQIKVEEKLTPEEKEIKYKDTYERIAKLYPYLSASFIRIVYDLKGQLSREYPVDKKTIVLHRVSFNDVDNLRKFCEIGLNHDYQINADEDKMIVDIFKEFINSDGKILANIYEIANQGCLLGGNYEGYNVLINEE